MFDLYVGSRVETLDKDKLTLTGEKLSLTLHAGLVAATQSPLCVFLIFLSVCLPKSVGGAAVFFRSLAGCFSYILNSV